MSSDNQINQVQIMVKVRRAPKRTKVKASSPVEKWNRVQTKKSKKSSAVLESLPGCIECGEAIRHESKKGAVLTAAI